jgi:hypothetical protein
MSATLREPYTITLTGNDRANLQSILRDCRAFYCADKGTGVAHIYDQLLTTLEQPEAPALNDSELTNLRTACWTSSMRTEPKWREGLDALANKLDVMRTAGEKRHVA